LARSPARTTLYNREIVPKGWSLGGVAPHSARVLFVMALK